jgi:hypothetical protein
MANKVFVLTLNVTQLPILAHHLLFYMPIKNRHICAVSNASYKVLDLKPPAQVNPTKLEALPLVILPRLFPNLGLDLGLTWCATI